MKDWIAIKVEDILDWLGLHKLADWWYNWCCNNRWYRPKYRY